MDRINLRKQEIIMKKNINVNLSDMANGAVQVKLNRAMEQVVKNILDPNTDATKKRRITLNLTITPAETRDSFALATQVKTTLVPEMEVPATVLVGKSSDGKLVANELKSGTAGQEYFDPEDSTLKDDKGNPIEDQKSTVIDLQKQKKAGK